MLFVLFFYFNQYPPYKYERMSLWLYSNTFDVIFNIYSMNMKDKDINVTQRHQSFVIYFTRNLRSSSPASLLTKPSMPRSTDWPASLTFRGPKTPMTCSTTGPTNSTRSCLWSTRPRILLPRRRWSTTCSELTSCCPCCLLVHVCLFFFCLIVLNLQYVNSEWNISLSNWGSKIFASHK